MRCRLQICIGWLLLAGFGVERLVKTWLPPCLGTFLLLLKLKKPPAPGLHPLTNQPCPRWNPPSGIREINIRLANTLKAGARLH